MQKPVQFCTVQLQAYALLNTVTLHTQYCMHSCMYGICVFLQQLFDHIDAMIWEALTVNLPVASAGAESTFTQCSKVGVTESTGISGRMILVGIERTLQACWTATTWTVLPRQTGYCTATKQNHRPYSQMRTVRILISVDIMGIGTSTAQPCTENGRGQNSFVKATQWPKHHPGQWPKHNPISCGNSNP